MPGDQEMRFQREVMADLKENPDLIAWKTAYPPAGIPDIMVLGKHGLVCLFECKSYHGSPSARQKIMIERLRKLGIRTEVVRTLDKVHKTIKEENYSNETRDAFVNQQFGGDGDGR